MTCGALIHPATLVPGSGTISQILRLIISTSSIEATVGKHWMPGTNDFSLADIEKRLIASTRLESIPPAVLNPMSYLRRKFFFRPDTHFTPEGQLNNCSTVAVRASGLYFANAQDLVIFEDTLSLLNSIPPSPNAEISPFGGSLSGAFHNLNYRESILLLRGLQNMLNSLKSQGVDKYCSFSDVLCFVMEQDQNTVEREKDLYLAELEFPSLSSSQVQLMFATKGNRWEELILWFGNHLASESYNFASLPLSTKDELPLHESAKLKEFLSIDMLSRKGPASTIGCIDDFVTNTLAFYQKQIVQEAAEKPAEALRGFLEKQCHAIDERDPFYIALTDGFRLRHIVHLHASLHQIKLAIHYGAGRFQVEDDTRNQQGDENLGPHSWLCFRAAKNEIIRETLSSATPLWFERALTTQMESGDFSMKVDGMDVDSESGDEDDVVMELCDSITDPVAATRIQRWWKALLTEIQVAGNKEIMDHASEISAPESRRYGDSDHRRDFRDWFSENRLPQSLHDMLEEIGVRDVEDLAMVLKDCPELLEDFDLAPLDLMKLRKAVDRLNLQE